MAADENNAFDELMAQMGVRRLESGSKSPRAKGRRGRPQKAAPPTRAMRDAMVKASAPAAPPAPAQPPTPAAPEVDVEQLRAELRRARSAAQEARDRADATEAERARLAEANAVLDAERRGLQRRLQAALGDAPVPMPSLAEAFKARGVLGEHEAGKALVALVEARRTGSLLSLLEASDGEALASFLDDRVALHCGGDACPAVPGRAVIRVPKGRCEVCAGSDIQRSVRRFVDACLLTGQRHVIVVGGSPRYHRQLRTLVQHHRLTLELVPGNVRRNARQARSDLARADVVIVWGGSMLDHAVADLYRDGPARVLRIPNRGIGRMLELAAAAIDGPPASEA